MTPTFSRIRLLVALIAALLALNAPAPAPAQPPAPVPEGVWLIDGNAAVQIFACESLMCGRIVWLQVPRNPQGQLDRDKHNPDPALKSRDLCGLTILWGLRPAGPGRWKGGWFYNPDDGVTYRLTAQLRADDVMTARVYVLAPLFGTTKTLTRVPHEVSEGWC